MVLTQRRSLVNVIGTWQEQSRECNGERLAECGGRLAGEGALYERMTERLTSSIDQFRHLVSNRTGLL